jgi:FMN reductase
LGGSTERAQAAQTGVENSQVQDDQKMSDQRAQREKVSLQASSACKPFPFIVGIGGTLRAGSTTERAVLNCLEVSQTLGCRTRLFGGAFLSRLPLFDPKSNQYTDEQIEFIESVRTADGFIVGTPSYHGSISGVIKNALDTLEGTSSDPVPYFHGRAVGIVVTAHGHQAGGSTLAAVRAIVHAMRGWPTPYGAALNTSNELFFLDGVCRDPATQGALAMVAQQVVEFASCRS